MNKPIITSVCYDLITKRRFISAANNEAKEQQLDTRSRASLNPIGCLAGALNVSKSGDTAIFGHTVSAIPLLNGLPLWVLDVLYIGMLIAIIAWYYWTAIAVEVRRQLDIAANTSIDPVMPMPAKNTKADEIAEGVGKLPFPYMLLPFAEVVAAWALVRRVRRRVEEQRAMEHASAETSRIESAHLARAAQRVADFKKNEIKKFVIAGLVAAFAIFADFAGPAIFGAASGG